jgi:hypothetical protein
MEDLVDINAEGAGKEGINLVEMVKNKVDDLVQTMQNKIPDYEVKECRFAGPVGFCELDDKYTFCMVSESQETPTFLKKVLKIAGPKDNLWIGHMKKCIYFDAIQFADFLEKYQKMLNAIQPIKKWLPENIQKQLKMLRIKAKVGSWIFPHISKISFCIDKAGSVSVALCRQFVLHDIEQLVAVAAPA